MNPKTQEKQSQIEKELVALIVKHMREEKMEYTSSSISS